MPNYNNTFPSPKYIETEIDDSNGDKIGTLRVKPSGVLWKSKGEQKFHRVSLDNFIAWITGPSSGSRKVKQ